ncbi:transcription cofactor vestigial-like protein 4 isoform X2 [Erythrolamprus reginae]|uniref:transcription cofactor vestigial-like protein 4 isoform X2 n=1 Tax=Erythrolamprus reginae TaxID=121349 RepID=UPI00396C5B43
METPLDVLSRAASLVHADDEKREAALRGEPRMQSLPISAAAATNHRTGPPPISPCKRRFSMDQGEDDLDCEREHLPKMGRLFNPHLSQLPHRRETSTGRKVSTLTSGGAHSDRLQRSGAREISNEYSRERFRVIERLDEVEARCRSVYGLRGPVPSAPAALGRPPSEAAAQTGRMTAATGSIVTGSPWRTPSPMVSVGQVPDAGYVGSRVTGSLPWPPVQPGQAHEQWKIEAGRTMALSVAPGTFRSYQNSDGPHGVRPTALLCGNSIIFWAGRSAARSAVGTQLSLDRWVNIAWLGRRGLRWKELLPLLLGGGHNVVAPRWLVLHLGGNDLGIMGGQALINQVREDLHALRMAWPATQVVWSEILQRIVWKDAISPRAIHKTRRRVNRAVGKLVRELGGVVVSHPNITVGEPSLFHADGAHLSEHGNAIFLQDLHRSLRELRQVEGGVGGAKIEI